MTALVSHHLNNYHWRMKQITTSDKRNSLELGEARDKHLSLLTWIFIRINLWTVDDASYCRSEGQTTAMKAYLICQQRASEGCFSIDTLINRDFRRTFLPRTGNMINGRASNHRHHANKHSGARCKGLRLPYLSIKQKRARRKQMPKRLHVEWSVKWISMKIYRSCFGHPLLPSNIYHDSPCIEGIDGRNPPWWWHRTGLKCLFAEAQYLLVWLEQKIYFVMFSSCERQHKS